MDAAWQQRGSALSYAECMQRQLHRKGLQRRPVRGPQQGRQQELRSTRRQGQRSPFLVAGSRSAPALEPMRSKGQAQVPPVSWPWIQAMDSARRIRRAATPASEDSPPRPDRAPLVLLFCPADTNTGEPALRSIRRSRDRLTGTTAIECCGVRCLHPPRLVPTRERTGRFLTVVDHPTTLH